MRGLQRSSSGDAVSEMLRTLHVRTTVFCRSDMRAPWGFAVKAHGRAAFNILLEGSCWLEVEGTEAPVRLDQGDVVVLPRGPAHRLRSEPGARVEWLDEILETTPPVAGRLAYGGSGARTDLICGVFAIEDREAAPLVKSLPTIAHVRGSELSNRWLRPLLDLVKAEVGSFEPGSESVVARIADVLLLQVMRHSAQLTDGRQLDARVGTALRLMREQPQRAWTVDSLARHATASRTALADHFRAVTGMPPMRYLTRLRMAMAARELSGSDASLAAIAVRVGYSSEVALSKAFTREMGLPPREYRLAQAERRDGRRSTR
ncbi:MAG TPA: AraC family transcriptional regulator [Candidatus Dormibacteraeota bacterium]|nr:AraC family transcriptional regulator [Candidatus Dormibacteraeota bacterium]